MVFFKSTNEITFSSGNTVIKNMLVRLFALFHSVLSFLCLQEQKSTVGKYNRLTFEPRNKKTKVLHMRKQGRRSALQ